MMDETTNRTDNGEAELEREIEERYAAMRGTPMRVPAHLREFMRATYVARGIEKAAAAEASAKYYLLTGKGRAAAARVARRMQEAHEAYIRENGLEEQHAEVVRCLAEAKARAKAGS